MRASRRCTRRPRLPVLAGRRRRRRRRRHRDDVRRPLPRRPRPDRSGDRQGHPARAAEVVPAVDAQPGGPDRRRRSVTGRRALVQGVAEDPVDVRVGEDAGRVQLVAQRGEVAEPRVALGEVGGAEAVHLAPVGTPPGGAEDVLADGEPALVGHPVVLVEGDIGDVAVVRRREPDVVALHEADLERERHLLVMGVDPLPGRGSTSPIAARGTAYSPSRKRTSRSEANTFGARSVKSRDDTAPVTNRVIPGTRRGKRVPTRSSASKPMLVTILSSRVLASVLIGLSSASPGSRWNRRVTGRGVREPEDAFPHRDARFSVQVLSYTAIPTARARVRRARALIAPTATAPTPTTPTPT